MLKSIVIQPNSGCHAAVTEERRRKRKKERNKKKAGLYVQTLNDPKVDLVEK